MFIDLYPNKTHLIIDFDKTLFRLHLPWGECLEPIREQLLGWNPQYYHLFRKGEIRLSILQNNYIKEFGDQARRLFIKNNTRFEEEELEDFDENEELLEFVAKNERLNLYIWSSNTRPTITRILKDYNLLDGFEILVTRTDVKFIKPNPEGFELIYDSTVSKERYLMLGDSVHDQEACEQAGINFHKIEYF